MTNTSPTEPREPDNPAAWALAQHIADHPVSTIQAAFRYLDAPLTIELRETPAAVEPPADQTAPVCKDSEGCHRVVPCAPGCGTRDLLAEATRPRTEPADQTTPSRRAGLRDLLVQAIRDAACKGDCGKPEEECAKERIQPFVWHHGRLAVVEGSPEQFADAGLAVLYREWPWLRAEAEDAAPTVGQTALREVVAAVLRPHASLGSAPLRHELPFFDGATPSLPCISGWRPLHDVVGEVLAVLPPPADPSVPREQVAEAVLAAVEAAQRDTLLPDAREAALAGIVAVLPAPADRAAVLRQAADRYAKLTDQNEAYDREHGQLDETARLQHGTVRDVVTGLRRMADETATTETQAADLPTLAAALDGFATLLATSSRDWGVYRVDAWLYAVICGWDCEQTEHDATCTHGALEEMAELHGWDDATVAKARRYRAAVRTLAETHQPAAGARQDGEQQ